MKLRSDLRLRKIGSQYMIVEPAGGGNRQAKVFELAARRLMRKSWLHI